MRLRELAGLTKEATPRYMKEVEGLSLEAMKRLATDKLVNVRDNKIVRVPEAEELRERRKHISVPIQGAAPLSRRRSITDSILESLQDKHDYVRDTKWRVDDLLDESTIRSNPGKSMHSFFDSLNDSMHVGGTGALRILNPERTYDHEMGHRIRHLDPSGSYQRNNLNLEDRLMAYKLDKRVPGIVTATKPSLGFRVSPWTVLEEAGAEKHALRNAKNPMNGILDHLRANYKVRNYNGMDLTGKFRATAKGGINMLQSRLADPINELISPRGSVRLPITSPVVSHLRRDISSGRVGGLFKLLSKIKRFR